MFCASDMISDWEKCSQRAAMKQTRIALVWSTRPQCAAVINPIVSGEVCITHSSNLAVWGGRLFDLLRRGLLEEAADVPVAVDVAPGEEEHVEMGAIRP